MLENHFTTHQEEMEFMRSFMDMKNLFYLVEMGEHVKVILIILKTVMGKNYIQ